MSKHRILIVHDEASAWSGLADLVSSWNYKTDSAESGEKALAMIPEFEPDVVITDTVMRGLEDKVFPIERPRSATFSFFVPTGEQGMGISAVDRDLPGGWVTIAPGQQQLGDLLGRGCCPKAPSIHEPVNEWGPIITPVQDLLFTPIKKFFDGVPVFGLRSRFIG